MNQMFPPDELVELVKYRLHAIEIGHLALSFKMSWDKVPDMKIYFAENQVMEGLATGFTNCAIESAIIHGRSLIEFLGLGLAKGSSTTLYEIQSRRNDDYVVERFAGLRRLTIRDVIEYCHGKEKETEAALAYVIYLANKGLAHTTSTFTKHDEGAHLLEVGLRRIYTLLCNHFFIAGGIEVPRCGIQKRQRN